MGHNQCCVCAIKLKSYKQSCLLPQAAVPRQGGRYPRAPGAAQDPAAPGGAGEARLERRAVSAPRIHQRLPV